MAAARDDLKPPADAEDTDQGAPAGSLRQFAVTMICDVVLPVALYYVLRGAGLSELVSILISGAAPALSTAYSIVKHRKVDSIGLFVIAILIVAGLASTISSSPRTALARGGWFTGLIAVWILGTLFASRPFTYRALKTLLPGKAGRLENLWDTKASFRRVWRGLNVVWGVGLLVDAALRVIMAYTLSVDTVPALDGALYFVTYIILQVITQTVLHKTGTFRMIFGERPSRRGRANEPAEAKGPDTA